ncbi:MAG: HAD-IIIA family hydrolase [Saprospiraceae bacterium]
MNIFDKLSHIKGVVLDIDGVLTDNNILVTDQGEFLRTMNVRDGYAIKRAIQVGIKIGVISGGRSLGVIKRLNILGIEDIFLGVEDKFPVFKSLLTKWNLEKDQVMYMGDDLPDLECLRYAGMSACPQDSVPEILEVSEYISELKGGMGCVRQVLEHLLQAQSHW